MVAGGREGLVGVGGLLLGGGKTFYTCRVGFACDQVINYEVVLADGSIVEANNKTNPDLFRVLKGGSNNFGVVTRFDMTTFPAGPIWDGNVMYTRDDTDALIAAFVDFTKNLTANPDAHVLPMVRLQIPARQSGQLTFQTSGHIIQCSKTSLSWQF